MPAGRLTCKWLIAERGRRIGQAATAIDGWRNSSVVGAIAQQARGFDHSRGSQEATMERRDFLRVSLGTLSGIGAFFSSIPFVKSFLPSASESEVPAG